MYVKQLYHIHAHVQFPIVRYVMYGMIYLPNAIYQKGFLYMYCGDNSVVEYIHLLIQNRKIIKGR